MGRILLDRGEFSSASFGELILQSRQKQLQSRVSNSGRNSDCRLQTPDRDPDPEFTCRMAGHFPLACVSPIGGECLS